MPQIASVVNQFESPDIQREVLQALVRAFEAESTTDEDSEADESEAARPNASNGTRGSLRIPGAGALSDAGSIADETETVDSETSSIHA